MLTNPTYKIYAKQIGEIFCEQNTLCAAAVKERLINHFFDSGFQLFLSNLSYGRSYIGEFKNYRVDNNTGRRYVNFETKDVITGTIKTVVWNWLMNQGTFYNQIKSALSSNDFDIMQGSEVFDSGNWNQPRIYYKQSDPTYGIAFVPGTVGSGGSSGNGGTGTIKVTPAVLPVQQEVKEAGIFAGSFDNLPEWLLPVGIAVAGYFLVKRFL